MPPLRDELRLLEAPPGADGTPAWFIYDPRRHRYFHLGRVAFELLSRWRIGDPARLLEAVNGYTTCRIGPDDLQQLTEFLLRNNLVRGDAPGMVDRYVCQKATEKHVFWRQVMHSYLFLRIPLVRPDRFLSHTLRWVEPLFRRSTQLTLIVVSLLGIGLVARQWDVFLNTFLHFFSLEGLALYLVALVGVKVAHELGHAYTAKRYGCRVPTMGIAFLALWPVLYTDTTDAWRLTGRRARLAVGGAGMLVELGIAGLATFAWSFLPDGPVRSAAFFVATTSWLMTLAVNLNPFMRFDGYYLLSDALGVHNLQDRAFALGRWRLREWLFGLGEPVPEPLSLRLQRTLVLYAWGTWLYRLLLFIGIALLVYHLFFKLLGLLLFAAEIGWFIARPVWNELKVWHAMRSRLHWNRHSVGAALSLLAGLGVLFVPWSARVEAPVVYRAAQQSELFPPAPARVARVAVHEGQSVRAGELLFLLDAPELEHEIAQSRRRIAILDQRIQRQATTRERLDNVAVLQEELAKEHSALAGLIGQQRELRISAEFDGVVKDLATALHPGRWVNVGFRLGRLVTADDARLLGYVAGRDVGRIADGAAARFYPEDAALPTVEARLTRMDRVNVKRLDLPHLASTHGGAVAVRTNDGDGSLIPEQTVYRVALDPEGAPFPLRTVRGTVNIEAESRSLVDRAWRAVAAALIRESGF